MAQQPAFASFWAQQPALDTMGPAAGEEQQQTPPDEVCMISYVLLQGRGVRGLYATPSPAYIPLPSLTSPAV